MKKILLSGILASLLLLTSGCFEKNNLDNATIYTTVYPVTYFTEVLYGTHSKVSSIYPDGADVKTYELTEKQRNLYSKGDVFVYNGLTDEKQIAKTFSNQNKDLQIIDVAHGLKYKYGVEELWLSPSNALMIASNIRTNLENYIGSKFVNEEIAKNYRSLEETLSISDAELRNIANTSLSKGKNFIVASSNTFHFLEDYGFQVTTLEDNTNENGFNILKKNFKNGTYKYFFIKDTEEMNDQINELKNNGATLVTINTMMTLKDENRKNNDTYLTIMKEFLEQIKEAVLN